MQTRSVSIVDLDRLLHPLQLKTGVLDGPGWQRLDGGAQFHCLGTLTSSRASRGQTAKPIAGLISSSRNPARVPSDVEGSLWRRGWTVLVPLVGSVTVSDCLVEAQQLAVLPPGSDDDVPVMAEDSVMMMFHPGPHACQREAFIRGSLEDVLRPTSVNQRALRDATREGWEGGVIAYAFRDTPIEDGVDISVLEIPARRHAESHRHGNRGEFSMLLGRGGRVEVGGETLVAGCFDLEGPRTSHQLRVVEPCWALQVSLDGTELEPT